MEIGISDLESDIHLTHVSIQLNLNEFFIYIVVSKCIHSGQSGHRSRL
jgi:hypothetical protein